MDQKQIYLQTRKIDFADRPFLIFLISVFILPGAGQFIIKKYQKAIAIFVLTVLALSVAIYLMIQLGNTIVENNLDNLTIDSFWTDIKLNWKYILLSWLPLQLVWLYSALDALFWALKQNKFKINGDKNESNCAR